VIHMKPILIKTRNYREDVRLTIESLIGLPASYHVRANVNSVVRELTEIGVRVRVGIALVRI